MKKGKHIVSCPGKPRKLFKRYGTLWACPECDQMWRIEEIYGGCGEGMKAWVKYDK